MKFSRFCEIYQFLLDRRNSYTSTYKLDRVVLLFESLGIDNLKTPIIHVAGTNGKGSTCAMLESIYRNAGYSTGMFTSPHLVSSFERIKVNNLDISEHEFVRLFNKVYLVAEALEKENPSNRISFFEYETAIALFCFKEKDLDVIILETGLGGRLDATNAIKTSVCSVITTIAYDHENVLGNTLEQIASEKAGIIKYGSKVVIGNRIQGSTLKTIQNVVHQRHAQIFQVPSILSIFQPPTPEYQNYNASTAFFTAKVLSDILPLSDEQIFYGISQFFWPGRWQIVPNPQNNSHSIILDGAHNEEGIENIVDSIKALPNPPTIILGSNTIDRAKKMLKILMPLAHEIFLTQSSNEKALSEAEIKKCIPVNFSTPCSFILLENIPSILHNAPGEVLITGSLYLLGDVIPLLNDDHSKSEYNEYSEKK